MTWFNSQILLKIYNNMHLLNSSLSDISLYGQPNNKIIL